MERRIEEDVDGWPTRPIDGGYDGLRQLAAADFSGAVRANGATLFMLNGRIVGVFDGSVDDFDGASGTAHKAPHPALPLLYAMQERGGEVRGKYYTNDTPISEVDQTLSEGGFTGFIELSENVLSGDYYMVYHAGNAMSVAFIGNSGKLVTGEDAFERADDEVGIYAVNDVEIDVRDVPGLGDDSDDAESDSAEASEADDEPEAADGSEAADAPGAADGSEADDGDGSTPGSAAGSRPDAADAGSTEPDADDGRSDRVDEGTVGQRPDERATGDALDGEADVDATADREADPDREADSPPSPGERAGIDTGSAGDPSTAVDDDPSGSRSDRRGATDADSVEPSRAATGRSADEPADGAADDATRSSNERRPADRGARSTGGATPEAVDGSRSNSASAESSEENRDRGEAVPDRGEAVPDRGEAVPDRGEKAPDQGDEAPGHGEEPPVVEREADDEGDRERNGGTRTASPAVGDATTIPSLDPDRSEELEVAAGASESASSTESAVSDPSSSSTGQSARSRQRAESEESRQSTESVGEQTSAVVDEETFDEEVLEREDRIDRLQQRASNLEAERDEIAAERDRLAERVEALEDENESLKAELRELEADLESLEAGDAAATAPSSGRSGASGPEQLQPRGALEETDLFVRYDSKGAATLEDAHDGTASAEEVNQNLRLDLHTRFDAAEATVGDEPFQQFLEDTMAYRFVDWLVRKLPYEIRDTGQESAMRDLYDALPEVDRVEFHGAIEFTYEEDGETVQAEEPFDVVVRDRMGEALFVADLNDSRDPADAEMLVDLQTGSTRVKETTGALAGAFAVTRSFFDPDALETAAEATSGSLLSRDSRKSYVKVSRKRGYHLCLVEARGEDLHLNVPEL